MIGQKPSIIARIGCAPGSLSAPESVSKTHRAPATRLELPLWILHFIDRATRFSRRLGVPAPAMRRPTTGRKQEPNKNPAVGAGRRRVAPALFSAVPLFQLSFASPGLGLDHVREHQCDNHDQRHAQQPKNDRHVSSPLVSIPIGINQPAQQRCTLFGSTALFTERERRRIGTDGIAPPFKC
jgi:hypothetical protein